MSGVISAVPLSLSRLASQWSREDGACPALVPVPSAEQPSHVACPQREWSAKPRVRWGWRCRPAPPAESPSAVLSRWPHARCVTQSRVLALLPGGAAPLHVQAQGPDLGGFLGLLPVPGLGSFDLLTLRLLLRARGQGCHWQLGTPGANVAGSGPPPKLLTVAGSSDRHHQHPHRCTFEMESLRPAEPR